MGFRRAQAVQDRNLVFAEYFNDEISVRQKGGVPVGISFSQGKATFAIANNKITFPTVHFGTAFSIRAIVTPDNVSGTKYIFSKAYSGKNGPVILYDNNVIRFYPNASGGNEVSAALAAIRVEIVATWDGSNAKLYVNSVAGATNASPQAPDNFTKDIILGLKHDDIGDFAGEMEFVEIYNKELSESERENLTNDARYVIPQLIKGRAVRSHAITAFSDHAATIDGATKVDSAIDFLSMIPQGAEEVTNGDFQAGTGADADDWTEGTNWDRIDTGGGTWVMRASGTIGSALQLNACTIGKYYIVTWEITSYTGGSVLVRAGTQDESKGVARSSADTFVEVIRATSTIFVIDGLTSFTGDVDNISVKELQVLGSDLVTNGSFTLGADLNVSNCVNTSGFPYSTFANGTPTGFDAISNGGLQAAGTADEILIIEAQKYVVTFDLALTSGIAPEYNLFSNEVTTSRTIEGPQQSVVGANVFEFTANVEDTVALSFFNNSTIGNFQITNLSVKDADTDWVNGDGWIVAGGVAQCDGSQGAISTLYQAESFDDGGVSLYKFTLSNYSAGSIAIKPNTGTLSPPFSSQFDENGTYIFIGKSDGYNYIVFQASVDFIGSIDDVSVHKLTFQKEIAESTNYTGDHYVLPVDENDFAIPVDYVAEGIVAQVFKSIYSDSTLVRIGILNISSNKGVILDALENAITNTNTSIFKEGNIRVMSFNGSSSVLETTLSNSINSILFWMKPKTANESIIDLGGGNTITTVNNHIIAAWAEYIYTNGEFGDNVVHPEWNLVCLITDPSLSITDIDIGKISSVFYHGLLAEIIFIDGIVTDVEISQAYSSTKALYAK